MNHNHSRRTFVRNTSLAAAGMAMAGKDIFKVAASTENKLPKWKGFNLLDFFNPVPPRNPSSSKTTDDDLKWMADWGFNFVRIPMAYPRYLSFDRSRDITKEEIYKFDNSVLHEIDSLVDSANRHGLHVSLNFHRGPGYCINAGFHEPYNLWKDKEAQDAFSYHWGMWAKRYAGIPTEKLSFDLLNEPAYIEDMNDQYAKKGPVPGDTYRKVAEGASKEIRSVTPDRLIVADGNGGGNNVIPELESLNIAQSCRGYWPGLVSHYQASWVWKDPSQAPMPVWPGTIDGKYYGREQLENFYKPWIELKNRGTGVHCGECGCYNKTPHNVFLAWFGDVIDILSSNGIGYALWNFRGDFGILDSRRTDIKYTDWYGHHLDTELLDLLKKY
ncbi:MAG TPA: cellulase family glycosylhydrolase [Bacteroidales bacterium]|jgi:aryl-phospho-beta-D-glucosidase BglC (GH1 family)|nr:cellulase family glycosylhydrolase [Bacteroidales bacterium]